MEEHLELADQRPSLLSNGPGFASTLKQKT